MTAGAAPEFWEEALAIITAAPIAFLATSDEDQPLVRPVTPAYEGITAYVATDPGSPKVRHVLHNPRVHLVHWMQDFRRVSLRARASLVTDGAVLDRLWDAFPYSLSHYLDRSDPPAEGKGRYGLLCVEPFRIELWSLSSVATGKPPQVWRSR